MKIPNPQIWSCWKYIFSKKRGVYKSSWWLTGEAGDTVCGINDSWILVIYRRWMDVDLSCGIIGKCLCVFITMSITNGSLDFIINTAMQQFLYGAVQIRWDYGVCQSTRAFSSYFFKSDTVAKQFGPIDFFFWDTGHFINFAILHRPLYLSYF